MKLTLNKAIVAAGLAGASIGAFGLGTGLMKVEGDNKQFWATYNEGARAEDALNLQAIADGKETRKEWLDRNQAVDGFASKYADLTAQHERGKLYPTAAEIIGPSLSLLALAALRRKRAHEPST